MPLITCPGCAGRTPASAARCVHCGGLPPACPDCAGTGRRPAGPAIVSTDSFMTPATPADGACVGCGGRGRRWPAAG